MSRGTSDRRTPRIGATPLQRSFDVYYRDGARTARMDALHRAFVRPGGLAFDIGAHVGDRTGSFVRLGASVVAVEPQPRLVRALRLIYGRRPGVTVRAAAVGAAPGRAVLHLNAANPTVATTSAAFVAAAAHAPGWEGQVWDGRVEVEAVTLDGLVAAHGVPDFVKIDVEGREDDVLAGLSRPLPALSFEVTTMQREVGLRALARLETLGRHAYALSLGEAHAFEGGWRDANAMAATLRDLPEAANSGDVFARLA